MQGNRGEATRCGNKASGIESHTRGWNVGIKVRGFINEFQDGKDEFRVALTGGSSGGYGSDQHIGTFRKGDTVTHHDTLFLLIEIGRTDHPVVAQYSSRERRDEAYNNFISNTVRPSDVSSERYNLWKQMNGLTHYICADIPLKGDWYNIERAS